MTETREARNARDLAINSLVVAATKVNESLASFSGWLIAGVGGAFSLLFANYEKVSGFVDPLYIHYALLLLIVGLVISIMARLLSAMVSAALGSHTSSTALVKELVATGQTVDLNVFMAEFERGLFPYQRWIAKRSMAKAKGGDRVASARMIAKLSQVQAMLVLSEALISIAAAVLLVIGLKAE